MEPIEEYAEYDISTEEWREVIFPGGFSVRIDNPVQLIIRKGGATHKVVDAKGVVTCYVAPESGHSVIRWKSKNGLPPVKF